MKQIEPNADRRDLFQAVLSLGGLADCEAFFNDLCTPDELNSLAGRWKVARLLGKKLPYREIADRTGISTATVTRVARCLNYGPEGGYRRALGRAANKTP